MTASNDITRDDFNSPPVRDAYEQFLRLVVVAGLGDRLEAMEVRRVHGVEKAVEFLGQCTLTEETAPTDTQRHETPAERRARIVKERDFTAAIHETEGVLWTIHGLAECLMQTNVQGHENRVNSIAEAIVDQAERVIDFLDRAGGWRDDSEVAQ